MTQGYKRKSTLLAQKSVLGFKDYMSLLSYHIVFYFAILTIKRIPNISNYKLFFLLPYLLGILSIVWNFAGFFVVKFHKFTCLQGYFHNHFSLFAPSVGYDLSQSSYEKSFK